MSSSASTPPEALTRLRHDLFPDDEPAPAAPGVIGKYIVRREIGRGGSSVVFEAYDPELDRTVAVKLFHGEAAGASLLARFHREAVIAAGLRHPGIVAVHDYGVHGGSPYIVMEFVDGKPLSAWMGARPMAEILRLVEEAARAIHQAHCRGVIHRDVKPQNILVGSDGAVRVADFGLAHLMDGEGDPLTRTGAILGTPEYMAPEQVEGRIGALDARTDVYALGVIAYEAATGRRPHQGRSIAEVLRKILAEDPARAARLNPALPSDLGAVIEKAMEKDPRRRYPSAIAFAKDLSRFLSGDPTLARPRGIVARALRRIRRRPWIAVAAGLALAGAAVTGVALRRAAEAERSNRELARRVAEAPHEANGLDALRGRAVGRHRHGRVLFESGGDPTEDYGMARQDLDAVLAANPWHSRARCERAELSLGVARLRVRQGVDPGADLEAAESDCREALRSNDREVEAWRLRGDVALLRADLDGENAMQWYRAAEEAYTRAIVPDDRFQRARMDRAKVRALRGRARRAVGEDPTTDFSLAEEDCSESLLQNPAKAEVWAWRANLRREMAADRESRGRSEEARQLAELAAADQRKADRIRGKE
ncbi:MAG: serine/threonine protein kinase [Planctomycetes bacterium]|nr:serine/threonine protein kinase [Planctomycetota bacterium]